MLNVTAVSPSVAALLRQDGLDPADERERVALGEIERAHQAGPDPLRALPLDAIAVVAADGHQLVAQEAVDGAADDVDRRRHDAADDDAAGAQRARERAGLFRLERGGAPAQLRQRLFDRLAAQPGLLAQADQLADAQRLVVAALVARRVLRVDLSRPPQHEVDFPACELVGRHDGYDYSAPVTRIHGFDRIGNAIRMSHS